MKVVKDYIIYQYEDDNGKSKTMKCNYEVIIRDKEVQCVFNTAFGDWGHSIDEKSMAFEYFSNKYNG